MTVVPVQDYNKKAQQRYMSKLQPFISKDVLFMFTKLIPF